MKLELKHLAPYLPYGLKIQVARTGTIQKLESLSDGDHLFLFKPILRPLSDLVKGSFPHELIQFLIDEKIYKNSFAEGHESYSYKIIHKPFGEVIKFTNHDDWVFYMSIKEPERIKHKIYNWLIERHFDVFGLIEKGLAIDINTID